jgi:hypothetical protein
MKEMKNIYAALILAQSEFPGVGKDGINPHFRSRYVTFDNIVDTIRPILAKHGLGFIQPTEIVGPEIVVQTKLIHISGETIDCVYPIRPISQKPQDYGSALTYAKRYSLTSLLGICADEDDDGNKASASQNKLPENANPKVVEKSATDIKKFTENMSKAGNGNAPRSIQQSVYPKMSDESEPPPMMFNEIPDLGGPTLNGSYVIDFGKFNGKTIQSIGKDNVKSYLKFINEQAALSGKPIVGKVAQFISAAELYLKE